MKITLLIPAKTKTITKKECCSDKPTITNKKRCSNCRVVFFQHKDVRCQYDSLFHSTCLECNQTCSFCGQECGYSKKSDLVSSSECDSCGKESCMSCGININCNECGGCYCEVCFEENNCCNCRSLGEKFKFVARFK